MTNFIFPRNHISGLTLSTPGSSSSFSVAVGQATDSANAAILNLAAPLSKTPAAWTPGSGGGALDTGSAIINTWYWAFLIESAVGGAPDVVITQAVAGGPAAPTLPAGYTLARYIGSLITDGAGNWIPFIQTGDEFLWLVSKTDANNLTTSTTPASLTLSVPTGVPVWAKFTAILSVVGTAGNYSYFYPLDRGAQTATASPPNVSVCAVYTTSTGTIQGAGDFSIRTNSSAQIGVVSQSGSGGSLYIGTYGWIDPRGKLA